MAVNGRNSTVNGAFMQFRSDQLFNRKHNPIPPSYGDGRPMIATSSHKRTHDKRCSPAVLYGLASILDLEDTAIGRELGG